jgi:hypothetical protein
LPVIVSDDLLGEFCYAADCNLGKIKTGLLIYVIGPVKRGALMAGIGGDDGESARQSRVAVPSLVSVTLAPPTTAPEESVTEPVMEPVST